MMNETLQILKYFFRLLFSRVLKLSIFKQMLAITLPMTVLVILIEFSNGVSLGMIGITGAIIGIAVLLQKFSLSESVSQPVKSMELVSKAIAIGDFSKNLDSEGCYEVTQAFAELNQALASLKKFVANINLQADRLSSSSGDLDNNSGQNRDSAKQVSIAMEDLAKGAWEQSERMTKAVEDVNFLSNVIQKVTQDTEVVAISSNKLAESANSGQGISEKVSQQINHIYDSTQQIAHAVQELIKTSEAISNITSDINNIAEQTDLLALNASIEAAHAGEFGQGFAVVAAETGKLSKQTKELAMMIKKLLKQMNQRNEDIVAVIKQGLQQVETGKELTLSAQVKFAEIFAELRNDTHQVEMVAESARQMAISSENITDTITAIASFSQEIMSNTEEVLAITQEQSSATHQVSEFAHSLNDTATSLKESIHIYMSFSFWGNKKRITETDSAFNAYTKKYPNVKINISGEVPADSKRFYPNLLTQLKKETAPDIIQINQPWLPELVEKGDFLVNLLEDKTVDLSGFDQKALDMCTADSKLLGLPSGLNAITFVVNKDFFAHHKIPLTTIWNWDNLLDIGSAVHARQKEHYLLYAYSEFTTHLLKMHIRQKTGGQWINDDYTLGFDKNVLFDTYVYFKRLIDNGTFLARGQCPDSLAFQDVTSDNETFVTGERVGMLCCWVSDYEKVQKRNFSGCELTVTLPPITRNAKTSAILVRPQLVLSVNKKSGNVAEVLKFINWIYNNPDGVKAWGTTRGASPTTTGQRVQEQAKVVDKNISTGIQLALQNGGGLESNLSNHSELTTIFAEVNKKVGLGEINPSEGADEAIQRLKKKLNTLIRQKSKRRFWSIPK